MRVCFVLGTRPEIIKQAPLIHQFRNADIETDVIHTGQHYSRSLDESFFEVLDLAEPDYHIGVGSDSPGAQTATILSEIEQILREEKYDVVFVQGDTNSTLGGALAASKISECDLAHVEAGLRSFDPEMPEEINRRITDVCSDIYFVPTEDAAENLYNEAITDNVYVVGNTVVDAVLRHREIAEERSSVLDDFGLNSREYVLFTAHRQETVDSKRVFKHVTSELEQISEHYPIIYPIHPRAEKHARNYSLYERLEDTVQLVEPQPYLDFLALEENAEVILTDSGGIQEEAIVLGTPCITIRNSTERPETVRNGGNVLVNPDGGEIYETFCDVLKPDRYAQMSDADNPFGDGTTSEQILSICRNQYK